VKCSASSPSAQFTQQVVVVSGSCQHCCALAAPPRLTEPRGTWDCSEEGRQDRQLWLHWEMGLGQQEEQRLEGTVHNAVIKGMIAWITYHTHRLIKKTVLWLRHELPRLSL